jgi:hypothetical protein
MSAAPPPPGPEAATRGLSRGVSRVLLLLIALIAVQTLFPLLEVGLVTNDDLKLRNAALDRGARGAAAVLWGFTRRDGRLDIVQMLSWYVPFARDNIVYLKTVTLGAIVADLLLFALFTGSVLRSRKAAFLALLLALVGLQNSWEHSPLTAFPGLLTLTFAYLLGSFLAFQRYLEGGKRRWQLASAGLFLITIASYEMYLIYAPVFFGLALLAGRSWRPTLRSLGWHLAAIAIQLAAWLTSHALRTGNYRGITLAPAFDLGRIATVLWQFSVSSLPSYFFFSAKYDYLIHSYQGRSGIQGLLSALTAGAVLKAALVTGIYVFLMRTPADETAAPRRVRPTLLFGAAVVYFFAPSLLPALTVRYQEEATHQLGMQFSYYSLFAWIWICLPLLLAAPRMGRLRRPFTAVTALALAFASLAVDYTNAMVAQWQAPGRDRFWLVDEFIRTSDYAAIPEGAIFYAPSLWKTSGTLNFMGSAIDPRPSQDPKYDNFWTFYFTHRGGKRVVVADRLERLPAGKGFLFLRQAQVRHGQGQYLALAWIPRPGAPGDPLVSDQVTFYSRSFGTAAVIAGAVAPPASPTIVELGGGAKRETTNLFLFNVGTHFYRMGGLDRSAVSTERPALDVERASLLTGGVPEENNVIKSTGWLLDGWIADEARATLRPTEPSLLTVDGFAPDYIFKTGGIAAVTVTLELDGAVVATARATRGGRFRIEANIEARGEGALVVRCGPLHSPRSAGFGVDDRALCVVIDKLTLARREPGG